MTSAGSNSTSCTRWVRRKRSDSIPSDGGKDMAYGRYIHIFVQNCRTILKIHISQQIPSHCSYLLVRRVPTPETQLRWQVTGGCERSSSVKIWSCPNASAWNAEVPPGKVVPRGCKWPARAPTPPSSSFFPNHHLQDICDLGCTHPLPCWQYNINYLWMYLTCWVAIIVYSSMIIVE